MRPVPDGGCFPAPRHRVARLTVVLAVSLAMASPAAAGHRDILFWMPLAPGSPKLATRTFKKFARAVEKAAGWPEGSVSAMYRNTVEGGLKAVKEITPGFALVPMPVHLRYHESLRWRPIRTLVAAGAEAQRYSLFGPPGSSLETLHDVTITGNTAYDPAFVASAVLGGARPEAIAGFRPTSRPLSAVRKAARGETVAVLLDEEQRHALASLPRAGKLVLLAESGWMPVALLVRLPVATDDDAEALSDALDRLSVDPEAAHLMKRLRIKRFVAPDSSLLDRLARAYAAVKETIPAAPDDPPGP